MQNRLEHRLNNLATYQENLTASGVAHPRRGHGGGDDQVHEAEHPAAGRHEHARAGQPGPAGRPVAAARLPPAATRSSLGHRPPSRSAPPGPIFRVRGDKESPRSAPSQPDQQGVFDHGPSYPEQRRGVQHDRQLTATSARGRKSMEKLSSGYRINRPRTTPRASPSPRRCVARSAVSPRPAQRAGRHLAGADGGGALNEVHSILQRVRDLSIQLANGTLSPRTRPRSTAEVASSPRSSSASATDQVQRHRVYGARVLRLPGRRQRRRSTSRRRMSTLGRPAPSAGRHPSACGDRLRRLDGRRDDRHRDHHVSRRSRQLGAVQNRLEHRLNNLATYQENLTASESRIRDVDMAPGDGQLHQAPDPVAVRHLDAGAGQPGPAGRPLAPRGSQPGAERPRSTGPSAAEARWTIGPSRWPMCRFD